MLNGRLYRMASMPFLLALAVAAFSLSTRPAALTSTLAPDAFAGSRAFAELTSLASRYPERRPGSAGDEALARHLAGTLRGLGGAAGGGFSVRTEQLEGQTIDGARTLSTIIAQRPGSTDASPIVVLAHRDAVARGSRAELSGTAVLLELARVFAARQTKRTIILASTSGGSGGDAGAAALIGSLHVPVDAAVVLGDLAGTRMSRPLVVPYSDGFGSAPLELQRTVAGAITHEAGVQPGAPSTLGEYVHLAVPFAVGEQGVLGERGVPAVLVQSSGERGSGAREAVSAERLEGFGRAILSAIDALDTAHDLPAAMQTSVLVARKTVPEWAVRLLAATLLLGPLMLAVDGLARLRRRRMPVGRWTLWTLSCALPFFAWAVLARVLGGLGIIAAPRVPVTGAAVPSGLGTATAVTVMALGFALAVLAWARLVRRAGYGTRPDGEVAGLSTLLVLLGVAFVVWLSNPFTALLAIPALHLWLLVASPELRPRRAGAIALIAAGIAPLLLVIAFYAHQLGMGAGAIAWTAVALPAGGHIGIAAAAAWSVALGCALAAALLAVSSPSERGARQAPGETKITVRGPLTYAGPGSLGGTESALRR
ncbi:MAG: hypothetical protein QOI03_1989 [Solirubrobacteraceae bacterium]|nr:hypothetical protein [Solirubrobacteraceae bacterium]